ncbi:DUF4270 domain-containing protein [Leeuwenhoekiella nanhaiensis]|uniref:DUF4270 domain-containing protein n=1 Tax=Leeuwenhoekiella nanhaiensis TaxID=1655491 RepID=A0A2G1VSI4_9FLAO|nr:DUF4270 domain-containing protein [Leeuwenhoekiella nanhaiensis]PHQ29738.1 hypothetical protein CJ305_07115 [Leeuwenhoekiella nanhaiensis]
MKLNTLLSKTLGSLMFIFILVSCQDDFQEVGNGLVNASNFTSESSELDVVAYNRPFFIGTGVQTNGLSAGALGFYQDTLYGNTTASYLTQVGLSGYNPSFGADPVIDTVIVDITYFSSSSITAENVTEYTLDSVYGDNPIKLTAYRSGYFLSETAPPDFTENAVYYSNDLQQFSGIESEMLFEVADFVPSDEAVTNVGASATGVVDTTLVSPRLRLKQTDEDTKTFWKQAIFDQEGSDVLFNANSFRNYFRGIYLKAEAIDGSGTYFLFDRANSGITIKYTSGETDNRQQSSIRLTFDGTSVIGYQNDFKAEIEAEVGTINTTEGDDNLLLKGGQGSMAVIELFAGPDSDGDGISDILETERAKERLVREANLEFFVNDDFVQATAGAAVQLAPRIYIYNLETNQPLADFNADAAISGQGVVTAVGTSHLGPLRELDNGDRSYKIRITEHVKGLLNPDNENPATKLGIVVSQNLIFTGTGMIENTTNEDRPNRLPFTSIISQQGTVLYGTGANVPEAQKIKLRIFSAEVSNQ